MKHILFMLLCTVLVSTAASAQQYKLLKAQTTTPPPPATQTIPVPADYTPTTSSNQAGMVDIQGVPAPATAENRRTAAIQKVRNGSNADQSSLQPAQYSTTSDYPATYGTTSAPPTTTMTLNGTERDRNVRRGIGQDGTLTFTPIGQLHFVQFSVYCKNTPVNNAWDIQGLWLIWHAESVCPGGEQGAAYIVKGYKTPEEAKAAVNQFKAQHIDCWYNPVLSNGTKIEIIGVL